MIDVKIFKKAKKTATSSGGGYGGSYTQGSISEAAHAARADWADYAGEADHAKEADLAAQAVDVTPDSPAYDRWLRKDINDTSVGIPTFTNGIKAGEWSEGVSGAALWEDIDGNWHFESDFVNVRKKLTATEVAIQDVHHVGGQMLLTAASCEADFVIDKGTYYRVFFLREDKNGKIVHNLWRVGDQAYCQTFNLEQQADGVVGNHYFWRLVTGVSTDETQDTSTYIVDEEEIDASNYHYVDLSKDTAAAYSDDPVAGDNIVQLGYRGTDNEGRQTAILIAGAAADDSSPFIRLFEGIDSFTLPPNPEQLKPGDNRIKGVIRMMQGSSLEDGRDINNLGTSRGNLLRNTGFTGDYESLVVEANTSVTGDTPIYSDPLTCWEATSVEVYDDTTSASGHSARIGTLSQTVALGMTTGQWYVLSLTYKGSLTLTVGGNSRQCANSQAWTRIDWPFVHDGSAVVTFSGSADVREIMLTAGNLPCEWRRAATDNDRSMAEFFGMEYLRNAISEASTNILGGLILSQIIKVGNYRDGVMSEETGGMSGARNDAQSPYLWGGGTMEQAIYTIAKYAQNPAYQPTDAEIANMAKFVVTHGGRAILNDIILRGYIYALGGVFNGTIHANAGEFKGEGNLYRFNLSADERNITVSGPTLVDEDFNPISGAEMVDYMKIGVWLSTPNVGGSGYRISPAIVARTLGANLTTAINMRLSSLGGLYFEDGQERVLARYTPFLADLPSDIFMKDIPTSDTYLATGQVWNDNGTLKIKQ